MKRMLMLTMVLAVGLGAWTAAAQTAPPGPVTQPTTLPGKFEMRELPLPPMEWVLARPPLPRAVYGLYTWAGEYRTHRESIKKVGWRCLRVAGPMDDKTMAMLADDDMEVMMTLGIHVSGKARRRPNYDSDEAFIADYVKNVEAFLKRYGPGGTFFKDNPKVANHPIRHVEIWNEPNFQYMIPPREGVPRQQLEAEREALYAKLLPATYKAVKAGWPTVTVVGFGAGGASAGDIRFIQHVHEQNPLVGRSYDVLSTHPYVRPAPPESWVVRSWGSHSVAGAYAEIRKVMDKSGAADKLVWYTEVGWPISKADGGHFPTKAGAPLVDPLLQAAYVCRQYAHSMRLGVPRVTIMFVTDSDGFNGGFFLRDGSWRPSAYAVQAMIKVLPNPRLLEAVIEKPVEGLYAYRFLPDRGAARVAKPVVMAWNVAGPTTIDVPVADAETVRVIDMFGHASKAKVADGKVKVEVGPCPVYIAP